MGTGKKSQHKSRQKIVIFSNDPLIAYFQKGEIKPRYFNPENFFDEVHIITTATYEVQSSKIQEIAGNAELYIYPVGPYKPKNPFLFFRQRKKVYSIVEKIAPHVIKTHNPLVEGLIATYCAKKLNTPLVVSLHGDYREMRWLPFQYHFKDYGPLFFLKNFHLFWSFCKFALTSKLLEQYVLKNANAVLCVSHFLTHYAQKHGVNNSIVIYNKVYSRNYASPNRDYGRNPRLILTVGRIGVQKNQKCLVESIKGLPVKLLVIGDADLGNYVYFNELKKYVVDHNLTHQVEFIKSVPNRDIPAYYKQADIFAIASRFEGFCIPVLEAMAAGLPIVVNNKEPLPEVLGGTGLVVHNTPEDFRKAFQTLLRESSLRRKLGEKASARARVLDGAIMERREKMFYRSLLS